MKHVIGALLLCLATSASAFAADVSGVWKSSEATSTTTPGTLTFEKNGTVVLAPDGFEPLKGTYTADTKFIDITIEDKGKAMLAYSRKGNLLTVEYENGTTQHFTKFETPTPKKGKKK